MYFWPAACASSIHALGSKRVGLNCDGSARYSASVISPLGVMMGHDASTPATEYGPQWMNIPNFAFRNAAILSSPVTSARRGRTSANAAEAARYWRMVLLVSSISIMLPSQREVRKTRIPGADGSDEHFSNLDCSRFIRPPELLLQALFDQPCSLL